MEKEGTGVGSGEGKRLSPSMRAAETAGGLRAACDLPLYRSPEPGVKES